MVGVYLWHHGYCTHRVQLVLKATSSAGESPNLRLRTDNDSQYGGREFKKAMQVLGIRHEFFWKHTPEQNGHVESFHETLKKRLDPQLKIEPFSSNPYRDVF